MSPSTSPAVPPSSGPSWTAALPEQLVREILPAYLPKCRWFGGKGRSIQEVTILHQLPFGTLADARWLVISLAFTEGADERYVLPLLLAQGEEFAQLPAQAVLAHLGAGWVLCDAVYVPEVRAELLRQITRAAAGEGGAQVVGLLREGCDPALVEGLAADSRVVGAEQSNTAVIYGDTWFLKIFRKFERGPNPDLDITRFLSETRGFANVPPFVGALRLADPAGDAVLALVSGFTPNRGDGWSFTLEAVRGYFDRVDRERVGAPPAGEAEMAEVIGAAYLERARQLGQRTGEMHLALSSDGNRADFAAEPFTAESQRSLHDSILASVRRVLRELSDHLPRLPESTRTTAAAVVAGEPWFSTAFGELISRTIPALQTRIHGDYHLGQVLDSGADFIVLDFEGEPRRTLPERLQKRSPLVDVAGMLRSFDYAGSATLRERPVEDIARLEPWALAWVETVQREFLARYLATVAGATFLPPDPADVQLLLRVFTLDKALYEVGYELSYRPDFLPIPLGAVSRLLAGK